MAKRLFGTDGIRGAVNNYPITAEMALKIGRAVGYLFQREPRPHTILIGKDTRLSGYMLENALAPYGGKVVRTKVGDRYVVEPMREHGYILGEESSGHIIMLEHNTTGDAMLAALHLLATMIRKDQPLSVLASAYKPLPEVHNKIQLNGSRPSEEALNTIQQVAEAEIKDKGCVVIRASGTEPIIRIMVQHESIRSAQKLAKQLTEIVENPESGFNTFEESAGEITVLNETNDTILMENNDWGTNDSDEIDSRIDGPADYEPFLPKGTGMTAVALFCSVTEAKTQVPILDATVTVGEQTITKNENGVYTFPAIAPGSYTLTATEPDRLTSTQKIDVYESGFSSINAPLVSASELEGEITEGESSEGEQVEGESANEGEGEDPVPEKRCGCSRETTSNSFSPEFGELILSGLALIVLLAWSRMQKHIP